MTQYDVIVKVFGLRKQDVASGNISTFETLVDNIFIGELIWFTFVRDETIVSEDIELLVEVRLKNGKEPDENLENCLVAAVKKSFSGRQEAIVDFI